MGGDNTRKACRFANPPLNVCNCFDEKENGVEFRRVQCPDSPQNCERYETFSRILENLDRKKAHVPTKYQSLRVVC